jgi:hypothetical protein
VKNKGTDVLPEVGWKLRRKVISQILDTTINSVMRYSLQYSSDTNSRFNEIAENTSTSIDTQFRSNYTELPFVSCAVMSSAETVKLSHFDPSSPLLISLVVLFLR